LFSILQYFFQTCGVLFGLLQMLLKTGRELVVFRSFSHFGKRANQLLLRTLVIVLLSAGAATAGPFGYALDRILETTVGAVIGVAVSVLIAPARAHVHLREAAGETALLLAQIMTAWSRQCAPARRISVSCRRACRQRSTA
jgi:uncharacterized membrane protein YccC